MLYAASRRVTAFWPTCIHATTVVTTCGRRGGVRGPEQAGQKLVPRLKCPEQAGGPEQAGRRKNGRAGKESCSWSGLAAFRLCMRLRADPARMCSASSS